MSEITRTVVLIVRVGVDLAKRVIQVHAVDALGRRVVSRALKRDQFLAWCEQLPAGCLVAMEACSSAHHWGRKLRAMGLDARLIAAHFVSPYRMEGKSGKNDAADAAAICEAASRPSMRFVPIKSCEQQGVMSHFRHLVSTMRPRPAAEAYLRLRTLPGEQMQIDWAQGATKGPLRDPGHLPDRPGAAPADGLRGGAELLAARVPALLPERPDGQLA